MRKQGSIVNDDTDQGDINISPMIDMVFILLIFFIVTTVFVEEPGIEVQREYASSSARLDKNSLLIAISDQDKIFYGGKEVGVGGIRPIISRFLQQDDRTPVIVQVDSQSSAGMVVRVVDELKIARAKQISVSTAHNR
jgi:biopolymer transport protein ExbD